MSSDKKIPFTVNIEGNIASGKSILIEHLARINDNVLAMQEDVDKWTNFHGHDLLELKFKNPDFFQFPFQSYATLTRLVQHLEKTDKKIKIMERSLLSARRCFVETLKDMKLLHEGEYYVLQEWYDYIHEYHHDIKCDLIIYIQTHPEVAFERVNQRSRKGESAITLEYLKELHKRHEELFVEKASTLPAQVIVIDGNLNKDEIIDQYKIAEEAILKFSENV